MSAPRYRAVVDVLLKRSILDPQGRAVEATLHRLGNDNVSGVRVGKRIELELEGERTGSSWPSTAGRSKRRARPAC
ncbi:MAG: phosphoribosylformylglycinamidine synthase subunit PurS [Deinococcales bacterium]